MRSWIRSLSRVTSSLDLNRTLADWSRGGRGGGNREEKTKRWSIKNWRRTRTRGIETRRIHERQFGKRQRVMVTMRKKRQVAGYWEDPVYREETWSKERAFFARQKKQCCSKKGEFTRTRVLRTRANSRSLKRRGNDGIYSCKERNTSWNEKGGWERGGVLEIGK